MSEFGFQSSGSGGGGGGSCSIIVLGAGCGSSERCGNNNTASGSYSTALGKCNVSSNCFSTISGGYCNSAGGPFSTVGGGQLNTAKSLHSTVSGGYKNFSQSIAGFIGGGNCNNVCNTTSGCLAYGAVVSGGVGNNTTLGTWSLASCCFSSAPTICNAGIYSFIGGGFQNVASGINATISGGCLNTASCCSNFIGAGVLNTTNVNFSVIAGGLGNTATGGVSFIGSGFVNNTTGSFTVIGGGYTNTASANYSGILGGCNNVTCNLKSFVVGADITTNRDCTTFVNDLNIGAMSSCCGQMVCVGASGLLVPTTSGGGASIRKLTAQTLSAASWVLSGSYYTYTFSNVNITTNTRVDFIPDNASFSEVTTSGLLSEVDVTAGAATFYALFPPATDITGEVTIFPTV